MEQIIAFITPGSLTERVRFSTRVFTSWISLGLVLGLVLGIVGLSAGTRDPATAFWGGLLSGPIIICLFGLIGLGISSLRGDDNEHPGWYWYLFPVVTYIIVGFMLAIAIIGFCLALAGINLPSSPRRVTSRRAAPRKPSHDDLRKAQREFEKQQAKKFRDEHEEFLRQQQLELQRQLKEMERLQQGQVQDAQKQQQVQVLSVREEIIRKLLSCPEGMLLKDILTEEEIQELVMMFFEQFTD